MATSMGKPQAVRGILCLSKKEVPLNTNHQKCQIATIQIDGICFCCADTVTTLALPNNYPSDLAKPEGSNL